MIFDPLHLLKKGVLRAFGLWSGKYKPVDPRCLPNTGLGLVLWQGAYEDAQQLWLRWCDEKGVLIPTGAERALLEQQAREAADERAARLAVRLQELGEDA